MMATVHHHGDRYLFAVKGAPEAVLAASSKVLTEHGEAVLDSEMRSEWHAHVEHLAHHGLRVLACATKTGMRSDAPPYEDLTFVGLIGLEDPARADVPHAIKHCREAGIRVVMVTGDHAVTARSIARAVGLGHTAANVVEGKHVERFTGGTGAGLSDVDIFARVSPAEKLALVRAYQAAGDVVAMTGDGVNDAPALRQADIGVAMGLRGTDVAREAAAMILLDDAFPTIVKAIREGRVIFGNIRRFVAYLLSCNLSEVLVVGLAVLFDAAPADAAVADPLPQSGHRRFPGFRARAWAKATRTSSSARRAIRRSRSSAARNGPSLCCTAWRSPPEPSAPWRPRGYGWTSTASLR